MAAFEPILATALALGAPSIRVWAGRVGSAEASAEYRNSVATMIAGVADMAAEAEVGIHVEYHPNTLNDTLPSALALFDQVASRRANVAPGLPVGSYYQPDRAAVAEESLDVVRALRAGGHLTHVHVFSWAANGERLPLNARVDLWKPVLAELAASERRQQSRPAGVCR